MRSYSAAAFNICSRAFCTRRWPATLRHWRARCLHLRLSGMAIDTVTVSILRDRGNPLPLRRFHARRAAAPSAFGQPCVPATVLVGEFAECFGHIEEPRLVVGI